MSEYICHDFKTPRTDTSRRLPGSFRVVPITFYLALVAGTYFVTMDIIGYRRASDDKVRFEQIKAQHEAETKKYEEERQSLGVETARAQDLAKWIEGTRVIQPIVAAIARAIPEDVRVGELILERNEQLPAQFIVNCRMNGGRIDVVQRIDGMLAQLNYRTFSPEQSKDGDRVEYRSNLVWQER